MPHRKIAVIILAAGKGTRLRPLTEDMPKCLVPVAGIPLLAHMIGSLEDLKKAHDLSISFFPVTGFRADLVDAFLAARRNLLDIRVVPNADYATTNNLYSLRLAMDAARDGSFERLIWANGDCMYDTRILEAALTSKTDAILCDSRYAYNDESMKIATKDGRVLGISKTIPSGPGVYVSIDCYTFGAAAWGKFDRFIADYCVGPQRNVWAEIALHEFMQRENADGAKGLPLAPLDVEGLRWAEIDNAQDLALAEKLWGGGVKAQTPA